MPHILEKIAPYILAGGRSTRMGRDKAMLLLGGKTLLARAVETLRAVRSLNESETRVTVVGERTVLEGADRAIPDVYPGCGPLGGMEAALADLEASGHADWALFLPVDMPFLPPQLIDAMLVEWINAARGGAFACYVSVDGTAQPLVSLLHRKLEPYLLDALIAGQFKVTPVLQSACASLACISIDAIGCDGPKVWQTSFTASGSSTIDGRWCPTEMQQRSRHLWFSNLNSKEDFLEAEDFPFL